VPRKLCIIMQDADDASQKNHQPKTAKKNLQFYVSQRQLGIQFREMSRFSIFFRENVEEFVCVPIGFSACMWNFMNMMGL
jgi:hypothetical protein